MTTTNWPIIRNTIRPGEDAAWTAIGAAIDWLDREGNMTGLTSGHDHLLAALGRLEATLKERCHWGMDSDDSDACRAAEAEVVAAADACPEFVAGRLEGERFADDEVAVMLDRCDWSGWWPVIDGEMRLTGRITEGGPGFLNYDDEAMIDARDARDAGWRIAEGRAEPAAPVVVEVATADETIRLSAGVWEFAGLEHAAMPEACAAYHRAASDVIAGAGGRIEWSAPLGMRGLHSQWCGTRFAYWAGAVATMSRDLTAAEQRTIDAAHEAGLAAARTVIEEDDAASAAADAAGD